MKHICHKISWHICFMAYSKMPWISWHIQRCHGSHSLFKYATFLVAYMFHGIFKDAMDFMAYSKMQQILSTPLSQHCHNTVTTLSQHHHNTITTPSQHCHNTVITLSQNHHNTITTPSQHHHNINHLHRTNNDNNNHNHNNDTDR